MVCAKCEDLEEKVVYLESEMGLRIARRDMAALSTALGIPRQLARLLLFMYRTRGIASTLQIHDILAEEHGPGGRDYSNNVVTVHVSRLRKALGVGVINTVQGIGYELTAAGRDIIAHALGESAPAPAELRELNDRDSGDMRGLVAHIVCILAHRDGDGNATATMLRGLAARLEKPRVAS